MKNTYDLSKYNLDYIYQAKESINKANDANESQIVAA